jgi:hypothetical protein
MKETASFFVGLFEGLKLPIRWVAIIFSIVLIIMGIWGYEKITGQFYLSKLEKKVQLLKELQAIADAGVQNNPELFPIYEKTVNEISKYDVRELSFSTFISINMGEPSVLGKAISGAIIWIIVLLIGVSTEIQKAGKITGMAIAVGFVVLIVAALFAWIGTLIPTIYNPWVNYITFPMTQLVVLILLSRRGRRPHP